MSKLKITGINDDLKEIASFLVSQNIGFKYDGENSIVSNSLIDSRGRNLSEFLGKHMPNIKTSEVKR